MRVLLSLLLLAPGAQEEDLKKLDDIVRRLGSDEPQVRDAAGRDLLQLPVRLHGEILRREGASTDAEVRDRLRRASLPPEWLPFLDGTIQNARAQMTAAGSANAGAAIARALRVLEDLPIAEQRRSLEALLPLGSPAAVRVALRGMIRLPPKDLSTIVPFLRDPSTDKLAERILVNAGDPRVAPGLIPFLSAERREGEFFPYAAIRVMEEFGLPGQEAMLVELARSSKPAAANAPSILAATPGADAEEALCRLPVPALSALATRGGPRCIATLAPFADTIPMEELEPLVHRIRDPGMIRTWFRRIRREGARLRPHSDTHARSDLELACLAGPELRPEVLDWLQEPKLDPALRRKLVLVLGAVGGAEDAAVPRGLLREPGMQDDAAEALGRIGDPANVRALMDGFRVYTNGLDYGWSLLSAPVDLLEADLEAVFDKPADFPTQLYIALNLARRSPRPRVRAALFKGLLDDDKFWGPSRLAAIQILRESPEKEDAEWIAKLCDSTAGQVRISGLVLAQAKGDAAARTRLIPLLAGYGLGSSDAAALLDTIPRSPEAQAEVEAAWKKRPDWKAGRNWLVRAGHAEAIRAAKAEIAAARTYSDIAGTARALVAAREPEGLLRMLENLEGHTQMYLGEREAQLLAEFGDAKLRERVMLRAWGRQERSDDPFLRVAAIVAMPEAAALYRSGVRHPASDSRSTTECARALGRLKAVEALPDLRRLLRSGNGAYRAAAAEALAAIGDRDSIPAIAALLEDPTAIERRDYDDGRSPWFSARRRVWDAAMDALARLTGVRSEGASTAEARAFWRAQVRKLAERK